MGNKVINFKFKIPHISIQKSDETRNKSTQIELLVTKWKLFKELFKIKLLQGRSTPKAFTIKDLCYWSFLLTKLCNSEEPILQPRQTTCLLPIGVAPKFWPCSARITFMNESHPLQLRILVVVGISVIWMRKIKEIDRSYLGSRTRINVT